MASNLYVALSAQVSLERRMTTVANNVANMNTAGFRSEEVKFESVLSQAGSDPVAFSSMGESFISRRAGPVSPTGNPLDVAVEGEAWLGIDTPSGSVYTRDGRMSMTANGDLRSVEGYPVVDPGGAPITLDPSAGPVEIGADGTITQAGKRMGALGLFILPADSKLSRFGNSGVTSSRPAIFAEDLIANSVRQGYVEGSNVNPVLEMTRLIMISRTFDDAAAAIEASDSVTEQAIRILGST